MHLRRRIIDRISGSWMVISLITILLLPIFIGVGLYYKSAPILEQHSLWELITSSVWSPHKGNFGFWPYISSTLYVTLIAYVLSAPFCLFAAIHLTEYASKRFVRIIHPVIDILAGLPSVIYGVWGILVIVPFISKHLGPLFGEKTTGYSILSGGIVLGIMCIPYMLNMLIEFFRTVPKGTREASLSLGATYWESIKHVVIRHSRPGIVSAFGLSFAKAIGETIAVMMVVGNRILVTANPFDAGYPLPALIANNYGEMLSIPMYDAALMFAALLLLIIILVINLGFRYLIHKTQKL